MATPHDLPAPGPGAPTPPIALAGEAAAVTARLDAKAVEVPDAVLDRLRGICPSVTTDARDRAEASRDWWPLAMTWALDNQVGGLAAAVVRPDTPEQVGEILAVCNDARIPVTAAAGRSGVVGSSVPVHGGVVLDLCGLTGIRSVDDVSLTVDVLAGTFGDHFEAELRGRHAVTSGHWPQSVALSTVGGWLACRGAGQLSTRYGKIEDMVIGLDVTLADGSSIQTGGNARQAAGPDLNQLFVGSEGTLGVITGARLRVHPVPVHERRAAYAFTSFADGLEACRRILRRGATPAVLRLYDDIESARSFGTAKVHVLLVLDEGERAIVDPTMRIVDDECRSGENLGRSLVGRWLKHRNDVSQLEKLIGGGLVVDTMEITGPWSKLAPIYTEATSSIRSIEGTLAASAHLSHSYVDGACLYFTFAGKVEPDERDAYYRAVWDAGTRSVLAWGGSLSHHHGIGVNRADFIRDALGGGLDVLASVKQALDPNGILNPGKLGLPSPFGPSPMSTSEDRSARITLTPILIGALVAAGVGIAVALTIRLVPDTSNMTFAIVAGIMLSMVLGGYLATRVQTDLAFTAGAISAGIAGVLVQVADVAVRAALGKDVTPAFLFGSVFVVLLSCSFGVVGGAVALWRERRSTATHEEAST